MIFNLDPFSKTDFLTDFNNRYNMLSIHGHFLSSNQEQHQSVNNPSKRLEILVKRTDGVHDT